MDINTTLLISYIITSFSYDAMPGPVVVNVTSTAIAHNMKKTVLAILGANLGSVAIMLIGVFSMFGLIQINVKSLHTLQMIGAIYLFYVGIQPFLSFFRNFNKKNIRTNYSIQNNYKSSFYKSFYIGISNPKDIIFFVAFFPQFIMVSSNHYISLIILGLLWMIIDLMILFIYAFLIKRSGIGRSKQYFIYMAHILIIITSLMTIRNLL